ncbi:MAG: hypothetical protein Q4G04_01955 [bacterium]|nr:hypothetical protein [bacterium]
MKYNLVDIHFHTNDSFDVCNFDVDEFIKNEIIFVIKVNMIVKTDHNILNYSNYTCMKEKLKGIDVNFLPGIEINGFESKLQNKFFKNNINETLKKRKKTPFNFVFFRLAYRFIKCYY